MGRNEMRAGAVRGPGVGGSGEWDGRGAVVLQSKCRLSLKQAFIQGIYFLLWIGHSLEFRIENFNFLPFFFLFFFLSLKLPGGFRENLEVRF